MEKLKITQNSNILSIILLIRRRSFSTTIFFSTESGKSKKNLIYYYLLKDFFIIFLGACRNGWKPIVIYSMFICQEKNFPLQSNECSFNYSVKIILVSFITMHSSVCDYYYQEQQLIWNNIA